MELGSSSPYISDAAYFDPVESSKLGCFEPASILQRPMPCVFKLVRKKLGSVQKESYTSFAGDGHGDEEALLKTRRNATQE